MFWIPKLKEFQITHLEPTLQKGMFNMPMVQIKVIEGVFTEGQKKDMIEKVTDAMVAIEGENMRGVTWVIIDEVKSGDWGIGGKAITVKDVKAIAAGAV